jgi:lon-related putative ATP-dependent protease
MKRSLQREDLRRSVEPGSLGLKSTENLDPLRGIIGQARAVGALRFGLGIDKAGFNMYVAGPPGIGKMTSVQAFLEEVASRRENPPDWCYLYNFSDPYKPRALQLAPGRGTELKREMEHLVKQVQQDLRKSFESEEYASRRQEKLGDLQKQREQIVQKLQKKAEAEGFSMQMTAMGIALVPLRDGQQMSDEDFNKLPDKDKEQIRERRQELTAEIQEAMKRIRRLQKQGNQELKQLDEQVVLNMLGGLIEDLREKFEDYEKVGQYLGEVQQDILENIDTLKINLDEQSNSPAALQGKRQLELMQERAFRKYQVNVVVNNREQEGAPVIVELNPTYANLIGRIEKEMQLGALTTDFTLIKAGALLQALGGFLVLPVEGVLKNPFSWEALKRALRSEEVQIEEPGQQLGFMSIKSLRPQPVPLDVKVVLVGRPLIYHLLHSLDNDFPELFKVKADFATRMKEDEQNMDNLLRFICTFCRKEKIRHMDAGGVSRFMEQAHRLAEHKQRLSTNFGSLADLIREADHWAEREGARLIEAEHVRQALRQKVYRSDLLQERIKELIDQGTILIDVEGEAVGQLNGLSVIELGDYRFGRPSRITATVTPGRRGVLDIERQARLGGPLHSKGVLILSGYLSGTYATSVPLSVSARIVFEQSYEGVEGDSASSAELYAVLSALAGVPLKQTIAVTGSVNQHGRIQAVGGINEKIEGFFDVCTAVGLSGQQGVIIPQSNVQNLMLREDVVEACSEGKFGVWPVSSVAEGMEILTGEEAGSRDEQGRYPQNSLNGRIQNRLEQFARSLKDYYPFPPEESGDR